MVTLSSTMLCLTMTVYMEARGEPLAAQHAVAHVVLNRSNQRNKTVCEVVTEPNQFSWVKGNKAPNPTDMDAWIRATVVASNTIDGHTKDPTKGANHFWNYSMVTPTWSADCRGVRVLGNHAFCGINSKRKYTTNA